MTILLILRAFVTQNNFFFLKIILRKSSYTNSRLEICRTTLIIATKIWTKLLLFFQLLKIHFIMKVVDSMMLIIISCKICKINDINVKQYQSGQEMFDIFEHVLQRHCLINWEDYWFHHSVMCFWSGNNCKFQ